MDQPDDDLTDPDPRWAADLRAQLVAAARRQAEAGSSCERTRRAARPVPR
jgi:hypothetical protein